MVYIFGKPYPQTTCHLVEGTRFPLLQLCLCQRAWLLGKQCSTESRTRCVGSSCQTNLKAGCQQGVCMRTSDERVKQYYFFHSTKKMKRVMLGQLLFFAVKTQKVCRTVVRLLILMTLSHLSCAGDKTKVTVSCPEYQKAFGGSCYEFVGVRHTFFGAQAWCEQSGGHLAFIPDEETQYFFQRHLDPEKDVWFGVAPSAFPNLQYSPIVEGKKV